MTQRLAWFACVLTSACLAVWVAVSAEGDHAPAHPISRIESAAEMPVDSAASTTWTRAERSDGAPIEVERTTPFPPVLGAEPFALVVDPNGRPVPDALLELFDVDEWLHRKEEPGASDPSAPGRSLRVTADAQGLVFAPPSCEGGFYVRALGPHSDTGPPLWVRLPHPRGQPLSELIVAMAARVDGFVVDESGAPVEAGTVFLLQDDERVICNGPSTTELIPSAPVGPAGRFDLGGLRAGAGWSAVALVDGFRPARSNGFVLASGERRTVELRAHRGACISGRTVDEHGCPVADVRLSISYSDAEIRDRLGWERWATRRFRSGLDGRFAIHGLPEGDLRVFVEDPAFVSPESTQLTLAADEQRSDVLIVAKKGIELEGQLVDAEQRPMHGATVTYHGVRGRFSYESRPLVTSSDECGRFRFSCLDPELRSYWDTVVIEVRAAGIVDDYFHVPFKGLGEHRIQIEIPRPRTARLRVIDAQDLRPIAAYCVFYGLGGRNTRHMLEVTNAEGRCSVEGVLEDLTIHSSGYEVEELSIAEDALAGGETVVRLTRSKPRQGRITDEQDRPVSDAIVRLHYSSEVSARSDAEGCFLLLGVSLKHAHLRVEHPGYLVREDGFELSDEAPLVVKLRRGGSIAGRVTDEQGQPCSDCFVATQSGSFSYPIRVEALVKSKTDAEGRYELPSLEPTESTREYIVSVVRSGEPWALLRSPDRVVHSVCLLPGARTTVDLTLRPKRLGSVRGRLLSPDGSPLRAMVFANVVDGEEIRPAGPGPNESSTDACGCFEIGELRPGSVVVGARVEGLGVAFFDAEIAAERTTELEMRWPNGSVEVRLRLPPACASPPETFVSLVPQEQPLRGASMRASLRWVHEPDETSGVFSGVPPGRYRVFVEPRKYETRIGCAWSDAFDLSVHASRVAVDIALPPPCAVRIEVVDAVSGAPVPGALVERRFCPGRAWNRRWHADENGSLSLPEVGPGRLELWIASEAHAAQRCTFDVTSEPSMHRVALVRGACVRLLVVDAAAAPVGGARVSLRQPQREKSTYDLGFHREPLREGDVAGRYELRDLPAGRYTARAELGTQSSGDVELEVRASGTCEVRLVLR